ncbi:MAG: SCO family protein [Phycisphaeraceae bacterium]|nr:SCO family protein [Phycisphaeraceae bacterium]
MKPAFYHQIIVVLLALASLGATALVILAVVRRDMQRPHAGDSLRGGADRLEPEPSPPVLALLPDFQLTDMAGQPVHRRTLAGKTWIAAFIFTRCQGPCPRMISRMAELQLLLEHHPDWPAIRLVCLTVDPGHDTPAVLVERACISKADPTHWLWLTGSRDAIWRLCGEGFKLPVGDNPGDPDMPIFHSQKAVLVDGRSRIRGYYDILDDAGHRSLIRDLEAVLAESPAE